MKKLAMASTALLLLLLPAIDSEGARSNAGLLIDGVTLRNQSAPASYIQLETTTVTCEPTYGFLPCTTKLWGELFLVVVYEYLLWLGNEFIQAGSKLFFKMVGTQVFGPGLFQVFGALPPMVILLVNGLSGSSETAETLASMGMAMLAGAAVMLLTLMWGSCVAFGSSALSSKPNMITSTKEPSTLTGYGVVTNAETSYSARIMLLSMIPLLVLQLPQIFNSYTVTRIAILVALLLSLALLVGYWVFQAVRPWIRDNIYKYVMGKFMRENLLASLLDPEGFPDELVIKELFHEVDVNKDNKISSTELRALILGLRLEGVGLIIDEYVAKVLEEFDISDNQNISETEFVEGIKKWFAADIDSSETQKNSSTNTSENNAEGQENLLPKKQGRITGRDKSFVKSWWNYFKAAFFVILGTAIVALLVQPLMESLDGFASAANIPSFIISYVLIPLAIQYRMFPQVITSAKQKTENAISLTFSQIYNAVLVNNLMGLAMFLVIVYARDLAWEVSAQVLVVLVVGVLMGLLGCFRSKFPFWTCIIAFCMYPFSLVVLYLLTAVFGCY